MIADLLTRTGPLQLDKRQRARHLNTIEVPLLRCLGLSLISLGVFLNNRFLLGQTSLRPWLTITVIMAVYAAVSWMILAWWYDVVRFDLSLVFLILDIPIWTMAIYFSGGEQSWLFFILFMRVADQTQTSVARCFGFVTFTTLCYATMVAWIAFSGSRPLLEGVAVVKMVFIFLGGVYIAVAARGAERRRARLSNAVRMSRDLIRQMEAQSAELREARRRAEEASAAKSDFLANMSHEMRTPLHGILGMLQLLIDSETLPERVRQLEMARRSADSLLASIGHVLDFSKIEARKLDLEPVYFSMRELISDTVKALAVTAAEKKLDVACAVAAEVPDRVWGDPLRIRQVLVNLLGNAIKFTERGEIVVRVGCQTLASDRATVVVEVRDTGIGIDPAKRATIFDPFAQADSTHSRRYGGTGLGLAIVARLVDAMGGSISVDSDPGKGSAFRFAVTLPCEPVVSMNVPEWESALAGLRALVVEPNVTSREIICDILRAHGLEPAEFAALSEVPNDRPLHQVYACIIADAPIIGAVVPVVRIRSPLSTSPEIGVSVTRPIGERELIDAVGVAMGIAERGVLFTLERRSEIDQPLHVLVVDDHPVNLEFAVEALRRLGHRVTSASGGAEALSLLARETFDLVLLDIQMPDLDGLEVAERFRASERGPRTPVIALTAHSNTETRERCMAAGFDGVLTKPVTHTALAAVLRNTPSAVERASSDDEIVAAVGGNLKLLSRVRDAFAEQTPRLMDAIRGAIAGKDDVTLYESAHTLKGAISNFSVPDAVNTAAEVERAGRESAFDRAAELLPLLESKVRDLEARIDDALNLSS